MRCENVGMEGGIGDKAVYGYGLEDANDEGLEMVIGCLMGLRMQSMGERSGDL